MGNENRLKNIIDKCDNQDYLNGYRVSKSNFDIACAKLVTATTLMPSMDMGYDFFRNDEGKVYMSFFPTGRNRGYFDEHIIELDRNVIRNLQLNSLIRDMGRMMKSEGALSEDDNMLRTDDILMSALNDSAWRKRYNYNGKSALSDRVSDATMRLNTFRKILNNGRNESVHNGFFATVIGSLNYITNYADIEGAKLGLSEKEYFKKTDDIEKLNKLIRTNEQWGDNVAFCDSICAKSKGDNDRAEKLADIYLNRYISEIHSNLLNIGLVSTKDKNM